MLVGISHQLTFNGDNMDLLECMGIDPKEYAKVEAKIGLELAVSGRLEHRVCSIIDERINHKEVDDEIIDLMNEIKKLIGQTHNWDCDYLYYEDDFETIKFDYDGEIEVPNPHDDWLKEELVELKSILVIRIREEEEQCRYLDHLVEEDKKQMEEEKKRKEEWEKAQTTLDMFFVIKIPRRDIEVDKNEEDETDFEGIKYVDEHDLDGYTNHSTNVTMFGKCEAYFYGVCPASEDEDISKICDDCPMREEVIEDIESC